MIAIPSAPIATGYKPSAQVLRAATSAATSPHALVNLTRLIRALDARIPTSEPDDSPLMETAGSAQDRRKDGESLLYARAVLEQLQKGNEGSSRGASEVQKLSSTLAAVAVRYDALAGPSSSLPSPSSNTDRGQQQTRTSQAKRPVTGSEASPALSGSAETATPPENTEVSRDAGSVIRKRYRQGRPLSEYLSQREREDARGGEAGLLTVAHPPAESSAGQRGGPGKTQRDQLLAGQRSDGVMGNSQLHEELGGQLAEMSHRLKLNAIHFANSLDAEKPLLESSQQVLENNLVATQSSKKQLGTVTKKGRGTTCLTLGVVLLVLIIFVWTYLLIKFT